MKKNILIVLLSVFVGASAVAQSKSFQTIKEKFSDESNVCTFNLGGSFARTILKIAGEHEFNHAIKSVRNINLISVPKSSFREQGVTVGGFKKVLQQDSFDELARVKDSGDDVTLYLKSTSGRYNRYMIVVEGSHEVIVIEIKGYVDPELLLNSQSLSFSKI